MKSILICTLFSIISFGTFAGTNNAVADPVNVSVAPLDKIDITIVSGGIKIHILGDFTFDGSGNIVFNGTISVGPHIFTVHYSGSVRKSMGKYENGYDRSGVEKEYLEFVDMIMSNLYLQVDNEKTALEIPDSEVKDEINQ